MTNYKGTTHYFDKPWPAVIDPNPFLEPDPNAAPDRDEEFYAEFPTPEPISCNCAACTTSAHDWCHDCGHRIDNHDRREEDEACISNCSDCITED